MLEIVVVEISSTIWQFYQLQTIATGKVLVKF